jgi:hypothetical protein
MRYRNDRDPMPLGEFCQRRQQAADIGRAVAVDLAAVARDRVDNDKPDVPDLAHLAAEQFKIGLQAECPLPTLVGLNPGHDVAPIQIPASRLEPGPDRNVVLRR